MENLQFLGSFSPYTEPESLIRFTFQSPRFCLCSFLPVNTISVSNGLDGGQGCQSVGPDLGTRSCLQGKGSGCIFVLQLTRGALCSQ